MMKIRGTNIAFDDTGEGPVVVFIHGQPFDRTMWRYQVAALASTHRLIIPDLRGYGESDVPDTTTLLDELALDIIHLLSRLGIEQAVFVGLSMGGQVLLELYRLAPQLFTTAVLADTCADAEDEESYQARLQLADRIESLGMEPFTRERIRKFLSAYTFDHKPEVVAHLEQMMLGTNPAGAARAQRGRAERTDLNWLLEQMRIPVMIVVGADDGFTPVSMSVAMQQRLPHAELLLIENAGHIPNMEQADIFNAGLQAFLQRTAH